MVNLPAHTAQCALRFCPLPDHIDATGEAHRAFVELACHFRHGKELRHALAEFRIVGAVPEQQIAARTAVGGQFPVARAQGELPVAEADQAVAGAQAADPVDELELADVEGAQVEAPLALLQQPGGIHQELAAIGAPGDGIGKGNGPQVGQTPAVAPGGEKDQQAHQQGDAEQAFQDMPAYEALAHRQQGFRCRGQQHGVDGAGIGG